MSLKRIRAFLEARTPTTKKGNACERYSLYNWNSVLSISSCLRCRCGNKRWKTAPDANNRITRGWMLSGITSFTTGVPVQISEPDDRSLLGSTGNSPQSGSTDEPNYTP